MRFPNYPNASYQPSTDLVNGYLTFLGENEPDHRGELDKYGRRHLRSVAVRIGRGCLIAVNNNAKAAQRLFRRAMRDSEPAIKPVRRSSHVGRAAVHLHLIADLLDQHQDLHSTTKLRQEMHAQAMEDVRHLHERLKSSAKPGEGDIREKSKLGNVRGELAQKVALALVTRYNHPYIMAAPSLLHHDNGTTKANNYDMLVVESMPGQEKANAYKVQVKTACAGLCCDRPERRIPQQQYNEDIIVVSACCDLQRGDDRKTDLVDFRAAHLLTREYEGTATTEEIHELDAFSDSLILSITMEDERRMGTLPLYS